MRRCLPALLLLAAFAFGCGPKAEETESPAPPPPATMPDTTTGEPDDAVMMVPDITVINIDEDGHKTEEKVSLETMHLSEWNVPFYTGEGDVFDETVVFTSDSSGDDIHSSLTMKTEVSLEDYEKHFSEALVGFSKETSGPTTIFRGRNEFDEPIEVHYTQGPEGGTSDVTIYKVEKKI